jgi:hypothetical protein
MDGWMDGWMEMQGVQLGTSPTSNGLLTGHGAHAAGVSQVVVNFKEETSVRDEDEQKQKQTQKDKGVFTPPICRHRSCKKKKRTVAFVKFVLSWRGPKQSTKTVGNTSCMMGVAKVVLNWLTLSLGLFDGGKIWF